jgi:hypothetical protein
MLYCQEQGRRVGNAGETLDLEGIDALFSAEPERLISTRERAGLSGTRIGKGYVFLRGDALAFLRRRIAKDTEPRRAPHPAARSRLLSSNVQGGFPYFFHTMKKGPAADGCKPLIFQ